MTPCPSPLALPLLLAALTIALACGASGPLESTRPNLVLIVTDDQRFDSVEQMPETLARLAERGTTFTNAFATTPLCAPSRASILTGRMARAVGVTGLGGPDGGALGFERNGGAESTLAIWLRERGYVTGLFGKYLNQYEQISPAIPRGWDAWVAFVDGAQLYYDYVLNDNGTAVRYGDAVDEYSTDVLRDRAVEFIRENRDEPFFLYFAPFAPHAGATPAPRHTGVFDDFVWPRPPNYLEPDLSDKPAVLQTVRELQEQLYGDTLDLVTTRNVSDHAASMLAVDEAVAAIDDVLESLGLAENTVIVFTSDNGVAWGEHWLPGKDFAYEETLRVPLVMRRGRGSPIAIEDPRMVLNIDLAPTLADLAGARIPDHVDGRSVFDGAPWRSDFASEYFGLWIVPAWQALRTPGWKYVRYETDETELYDLASDPYELRNLLSGDVETEHLDRAALLDTRLSELVGDSL